MTKRDEFALRFLCQSFLSLVLMIILCGSAFAALVALFLPFWFIIKVEYTYGVSEKKATVAQDWGLFTYEENWDGVILLDKTYKFGTIPDVMKIGQIFFLTGTLSMILAAVTSVTLQLYRYVSLTGEMTVAGISTFGSFCMLFGVFSSFLMVSDEYGKDPQYWNQFPFDENLVINKASPLSIEVNFALIIGLIAGIASIAGAAFAWFIACKTRCGIEDIRRKQLFGPNKYRPIREPDVPLNIPKPKIGQYQPGAYGYQPNAPGYQPTYDPTMATVSAYPQPQYSTQPQYNTQPQYSTQPQYNTPQYPSEQYKPVHLGGSVSDEVQI